MPKAHRDSHPKLESVGGVPKAKPTTGGQCAMRMPHASRHLAYQLTKACRGQSGPLELNRRGT
jgi:hypothetical protein